MSNTRPTTSLAIGYRLFERASGEFDLAFGSFGCVFLPLQVIAAAATFLDFVDLFSH